MEGVDPMIAAAPKTPDEERAEIADLIAQEAASTPQAKPE